jgi:CDP-4-dehydro-6-deoxyglucose reductase, E1
MATNPTELKAQILKLTREYSGLMHKANRPGVEKSSSFLPGETIVPYAGRVFNEDEVEAAVSSTLDFWLTLGSEGEAFEKELSSYLGVKHSILVNSGSSANLIALSALTTHKLPSHKRLMRGDEVITVAAGFPTTVAPIIQLGLIPVFLDSDPTTGNISVNYLEKAFVEGKTKAVMIAHTLGNSFNLSAVLSFCRKYDLWLIEDNCDSLGSTYSMPLSLAKSLGYNSNSPGIKEDGEIITRYTGTWGDLSTQSFYPPHHITMGEGGAVNIISKSALKSYVESFRDWGRDCWCASGKDNSCKNRFGWQLGELPIGYDHKYIYSHLGYNLKPIDSQAAIGRKQLLKLNSFVETRKRNWEKLRVGLCGLEDYLSFSLPTHAIKWSESGFTWDNSGASSDCSWFGFMIRVKPRSPFQVRDLAVHLDQKKIGNRMLFGGNLVKQPVFVQLKRDRPEAFRVVGNLSGADELMNQAIFLGTYPGLTSDMIEYEIKVIKEFINNIK